MSDRATLFNLLHGLNGYTISTGILSTDLNGLDILSIPIISDEVITLGCITSQKAHISYLAKQYISELKIHIKQYGFDLLEKSQND